MSIFLGIEQGTTFLKNSANKLLKSFKTKKIEGFDGILGNNTDMANVIAGETENTRIQRNHFNDNIAQYGTDYAALKQKTAVYLNDSDNDYQLKKNYNIFINKSQNQDQIQATNQLGCVSAESARQSLKDITEDQNFITAYPNNFTNYADANAACKLWAADTNSTIYAVNQNRNGKDFQCHIGKALLPHLEQHTKAHNLYTLTTGDSTTTRGGLFGDGQIGAFSGTIVDQKWNINAMMRPTLIKKYNSTDYSDGTSVLAGTDVNWWGQPPTWISGNPPNSWGKNFFTSDKSAWWMSTADIWFVGTMGYFYYTFELPANLQYSTLWVYIVADDQCDVKVNGQIAKNVRPSNRFADYGNGGFYEANNVVSGKNVCEVTLINTGGPGAFVLYAYLNYEIGTVFTSSGVGWGYTNTPVDDHNKITKAPFDATNPYGIHSVNATPTGYEQCHPIMGGNLNANTLRATYGKNCSGKPLPPASSCYSWSCSIEGQKCLKDSPGAGNLNWRCETNRQGQRKWTMEMPENADYYILNKAQNASITTRVSENRGYGTGPSGVDVAHAENDKNRWNFRPTNTKDVYMIHSQDKDTCLFNNADGRLGVAGCNPDWNDQHWKVLQDHEGGDNGLWNFQLQSVNSNKCLQNTQQQLPGGTNHSSLGVERCNNVNGSTLWHTVSH